MFAEVLYGEPDVPNVNHTIRLLLVIAAIFGLLADLPEYLGLSEYGGSIRMNLYFYHIQKNHYES